MLLFTLSFSWLQVVNKMDLSPLNIFSLSTDPTLSFVTKGHQRVIAGTWDLSPYLQQAPVLQTATAFTVYISLIPSTQHPASSSSTLFWRFCSRAPQMGPLPPYEQISQAFQRADFFLVALLIYHSMSIGHTLSNKA